MTNSVMALIHNSIPLISRLSSTARHKILRIAQTVSIAYVVADAVDATARVHQAIVDAIARGIV